MMGHAYGPPHTAATAAEAHIPPEHDHPTLTLTQRYQHKAYHPSQRMIFVPHQKKIMTRDDKDRRDYKENGGSRDIRDTRR